MSHVIVLNPVVSPISRRAIDLKLRLYYTASDFVVPSVAVINARLNPSNLKTLLCGSDSDNGLISSLIDSISQYPEKLYDVGAQETLLLKMFADRI